MSDAEALATATEHCRPASVLPSEGQLAHGVRDRRGGSGPMSLCFYTDTFFPTLGGAEVVLDNLAGRLARLGHSVVVAAPRAGKGCRDAGLCYRVSRYRKPLTKRFAQRLALPRLVALHARHRFDVVHCHAAYPQAYVAATLKKWFHVPVAVRPHGSDVLPGERVRANPRLQRRLRAALNEADAVIAQGRFLKDVILGLGVDEKRVRVIHNGVDLAAFAKAPRYPHPRPYLLGLGNLLPRKGFDVLIRAYARLENPQADLILAGSGPERSKLAALVAQVGVAERVKFVGRVQGEEKVSLYRSAEVFVCPSRREPFANVILEALASGLPIVASAVGGNTELVCDGEHGLLVPPEDDAALAAAMGQLLDGKALSARFRAAAARFVRDFDWPRIAGRYLDLYRELAEGR